MLVYGDIETNETVGAKQDAVWALLSEIRAMPPGIERHGALVSAFIGTSELVQGLIDAAFHERGFDTLCEIHEAGMDCVTLLAGAVVESWRSGFEQGWPPEAFFEKLLSFDPSRTIRTKQAEGYAFYALYPESYLEAARAAGLGPETQVIGIRSIGTGLSALVAAAIGSPSPLTLRPVGHPFGREVKVDPAITDRLTTDRGKTFAIVDEGPGLSGSSFGAVADWLEAAGVARERIHFFPSHGGPLGPQASDQHRERWSKAPRHLVSMDDVLLRSQPPHDLAAWIEEVIGPLDQPLEEISGGAWRWRRYPDEAEWPPSNVQQERRKFLAQANGQSWLVKFVGLGEIGARKFRIAQQLHGAGFTPKVAGYRHGFLVERWHEDARSLDRHTIDRSDLVGQVGAYLGFRARHLPAAEPQGASLDELRHMAIYNTGQAFGDEAAARLAQSLSPTDLLNGRVRRVSTDNRVQAWEWLVAGGRLIKTDALDHSTAHDLIGQQDITWDLAGAVIELDLSDEETSRLCTLVQRESGHPVSLELLAFMLPCYLAFQMGALLMAAMALGEGPEAVRLRAAAHRYGRLLQRQERLTGISLRQEQEQVPAS
jgi:hypothetical protein